MDLYNSSAYYSTERLEKGLFSFVHTKERMHVVLGDLICKAEQGDCESLRTDRVGIHFTVGGRYDRARREVPLADTLHIFFHLLIGKLRMLGDQ